jgi:hypothetical protein
MLSPVGDHLFVLRFLQALEHKSLRDLGLIRSFPIGYLVAEIRRGFAWIATHPLFADRLDIGRWRHQIAAKFSFGARAICTRDFVSTVDQSELARAPVNVSFSHTTDSVVFDEDLAALGRGDVFHR